MRLTAFLRPPLRPRWSHLLGALVLGAGVALGQAPFGGWTLTLGPIPLRPVLFLALPALSLLLRLAAGSSAGWVGFMAGLGYVMAGMFWITEPFMVEPEIYGWMAPFALVLMGAGMGAFWALGAGLGAMLGHSTARRTLGVALGLTASDALRSYVFTGFPWILFGHVWIPTPVAQAAAFIGPIGLSLLTLVIASFPWLMPGRWLRGACASVLAVALLWWAGDLRLDPPLVPRAPAVNLRIVQPNATQALKWNPEYRLPFFYRHLDLTAMRPGPGGPKPDLVIWPETAVPFLLDDAGEGIDMIANAAGGATVALGIQRSDGARYYDSLAIVRPDGQVGQVYDKVHLVPFGEYIPFGDALARVGIHAFAAREGNGYTSGTGQAVFDLGPFGHVQPLICYEDVFPQDIRNAPARPDWIMVVTNDAWFGNISGPWQHLALSQLRAIEFGLPVARSANTGVSALIDARGQILHDLGMNIEGVIDAPLPPALPETLYARTGDAPAIAALVVALLLVLLWPRQYGVDRKFRRV